MPDLDDGKWHEDFEKYLTKFRPLVPESLPQQELRLARTKPYFRFATAALGAIMLVILGFLSFRMLNQGAPERAISTSVQTHSLEQPLTIRNVDQLLADAPSYKSAIDQLALPRVSSVPAKERQSALAVLAKEKIKL